MSHTDTTTLSQSLPALPQRTCYSATVVDDGQPVLTEIYPEPWQRRNAVVELLSLNHDEVEPADVQDILDRFGGADPDEALAQIASLYADFGVDVYLADVQIPQIPQEIWSVYTDYGNGDSIMEHFYSQEDRRQALIERCQTLTGDPVAHDQSEEHYVAVVRDVLKLTSGSLELRTARLSEDSTYYREEG